jgi:heme exporter protein D
MGFSSFNAILNIGGIFFALAFFIALVIKAIVLVLIKIIIEKKFPKYVLNARKNEMEIEE